jgi:peptidyl-prolyl cis-trans isomerase B (cyclophilin B)
VLTRSLLAAVLTLAVTACGSGGPPRATTAPAGARGASGGCRRVPVPRPRGAQHLRAPTLRLDPAKTYTVHVTTNCGSFAFTLDVKNSPKTSASIYALVRRGFYDGLTFHRVAAGFVIQGGDPLGDGSGGPGYTIVEAPPAGTHYAAGDVAMAKTQAQPPGASGSQFFVVTAEGPSAQALTPDYALAGKVVSGMDVVDRIGALPTTPPGDGAPTPPVVMSRVTVSVG